MRPAEEQRHVEVFEAEDVVAGSSGRQKEMAVAEDTSPNDDVLSISMKPSPSSQWRI
jgi:hypothetical protein